MNKTQVNANWTMRNFPCTNCHNLIEFRVAHKALEFKNHYGWEKIQGGTEIVLCNNCGKTFFLRMLKSEAGL